MQKFAAVSFLLFVAPLAAQEWQRIPSTAHPPQSGFVAMAYDAARDRIVCVVDQPETGPFASSGRFTTWEWDGGRWLHRETASTPPGLGYSHAAAYDPTRGRVVHVNRNGETWSFDGVDWQQEAILGVGGDYQSLAFDAARGVLVLAAGSGLSHGIYEVAAGAWTQRATFTPWGEGAVIGFDPISARIVVFGGLNYSGVGPVNVSDTRAWDGTTLTTLSPSTIPNGRAQHALANDPQSGQLLLVGGFAYQSPIGAMADVHVWNGTDWVVQPSLPTPRMRPAAAPHGGSLCLFGGSQVPGMGYSHELLRRAANGTWTTVPLVTSGTCAAHDTLRDRTVAVQNGRTVEFDGYRWSDVGIPFPSPTGVAAITFNLLTAQTVAFAGDGSTWLYDGLAWTQAITPTAPPSRAGAGMGYDPVRNVVVLTGGINGTNAWLNDIWEWNGVAWSNPQPAGIVPGGVASIVWDGQQLVALSVVPSAAQGVTWTWNGSAASVVAPSPGIAVNPRLAHDPALGLVAVLSPALPFTTADQWMQFVGGAWQIRGPVASDTGNGALVFDTNRGQLLLHDAWNHRDHVLSAQLATQQSLGGACSGTAAVPRFTSPVLPQIGTTGVADVDRATPNSFVFLFGDVVQANVPLPGGCIVHLQNPMVLAAAPTNAAGFASMEIMIPASPALRGADVFEQALVLDPAGVLFGFANLSNGMRLRIGD